MAIAKSRGRSEAAAKPAGNDAYTGMLALSFLALLAGSVLLYLDYQEYDSQMKSVSAPKVDLTPQGTLAAPTSENAGTPAAGDAAPATPPAAPAGGDPMSARPAPPRLDPELQRVNIVLPAPPAPPPALEPLPELAPVPAPAAPVASAPLVLPEVAPAAPAKPAAEPDAPPLTLPAFVPPPGV